MTSFIVFPPLAKVDTAKRLVYGMLGAEVPDKAGEIFDYESAKPSPRDAPRYRAHAWWSGAPRRGGSRWPMPSRPTTSRETRRGTHRHHAADGNDGGAGDGR